MAASILIRRLVPQDWEAYRAMRLRALADAPDAFCATLAEAQAWPEGEWLARLERAAVSGIDCPLVAEQEGAFVGLLWAKVDAADAARVTCSRCGWRPSAAAAASHPGCWTRPSPGPGRAARGSCTWA